MPIADLHLHLLPGVDDGPPDWETTEAMLSTLAKHGVKLVAPTPHVGEGDWQAFRERQRGLEALSQRAALLGIRVVGAAELWATPDLPDHWEAVLSLTYGGMGKYALLEFDVAEMPLFAEWLLFQFKVRGVTPIVAHPERYLWVQEDERNLYRLLATGALVQVGADSLLRPETPMGKTAWRLVQNRLVDFIASDWHAPTPPYPMAQVVQKLKNAVGSETVEQLVWRVPRQIVEGQPVLPAWHRSPCRFDITAFLSGQTRLPSQRRWWHFLTFWRRNRGGV